MTKLAKLTQPFKDTVAFLTRFTFPIRKSLLRSLVVLGVLGVFLFNFPLVARLIYDYAFVTIMMLGIYSEVNVYAHDAMQIVSMTFRGKKYKTTEYTTPKIEQLKAKMNLPDVKVFKTNNPYVRGPFTNGATCKVYLTEEWMNNFGEKENLSTLAHEFGHVQTRKRFVFEMLGVTGLVLALSLLMSLRTISIIVEVTEIAGFFLGVMYVCWHNERRADMISAKYLGPEGLISVLEQIQAKTKHDDGSETHPPLQDRIARLTRLLNKPRVHDI